MIIITLTLIDTENITETDTVKTIFIEDAFTIEKGYSQKELFALYQRARAKFGITKFSKDKENL